MVHAVKCKRLVLYYGHNQANVLYYNFIGPIQS